MNRKSAREPIVCVLNSSWPKVSTTFIAQEFVGLEGEGLKLLLATYGDADPIVHPIHAALKAPILRLPRRPIASPRFAYAWLKLHRTPGYRAAHALMRERSAAGKRFRHRRAFARAAILAAELPRDVAIIYSHFIDTPTTLALYAAMISGRPLAVSAHARDIWVNSKDDLQGKLKVLKFVATCTTPGADYLRELADDPGKVHLVHHGLSLDRVPEAPQPSQTRDGSDPADPVRLLSVGRAVEKKGFDDLLEALAQLPRDLNWHWHHIGTGRIIDRLQAHASRLGLQDRITWHGSREQQFVIDRYRDSDLFVLPSREAEDGDRDGLPNVLMEAQSQALACLSTRFSAIPELIDDGETGVLVPPSDRAALTHAIVRLARAPAERARLGSAGCRRVREHFRSEYGIRVIAQLLRDHMAAPGR